MPINSTPLGVRKWPALFIITRSQSNPSFPRPYLRMIARVVTTAPISVGAMEYYERLRRTCVKAGKPVALSKLYSRGVACLGHYLAFSRNSSFTSTAITFTFASRTCGRVSKHRGQVSGNQVERPLPVLGISSNCFAK